MSYGAVLLETLVKQRYDYLSEGRTPIAIRLMPSELNAIIVHLHKTGSLYQYVGGSYDTIFGMAIHESVVPPHPSERFVFESRVF